ncbi:helix-turn-helix domain-containing protein [Bacillus sp. 31A1R]|uniref:Helix-turn-helix domain-containing protein n=1 Tax=Robertmurraya mangrovi TaxID=3098077 RepID=A0ABU5ISY8_9BACI|nr:helix-turn-helix domain-containing protein [Bacillus sp. 31A1R]MDZ5470265.1 helix-turn-helix domain-containing protein [Bacillus sp. 31A1R]
MNEKERAIIETGMKLFASKGFNSTSVHEIAVESGISKGAFYLHFKSKDDLLLAILQFCFGTIHHNVSKFEDQDMPPREKFIKQLNVLSGTFIEHKEFFIMLSKEQAIPRNDTIKELLFKEHLATHRFFHNGLSSIYGSVVEHHLWDLALMLEGLYNSYIKLLLFAPLKFNLNDLTHFILRRMDSIVKDISSDQSFLSEEKVNMLFKHTNQKSNTSDIRTILKNIRQEIDQFDNKQALEISLDVLEEEIQKEHPRIPVIKGMLSNFENIDALDHYRKEIALIYDLK